MYCFSIASKLLSAEAILHNSFNNVIFSSLENISFESADKSGLRIDLRNPLASVDSFNWTTNSLQCLKLVFE